MKKSKLKIQSFFFSTEVLNGAMTCFSKRTQQIIRHSEAHSAMRGYLHVEFSNCITSIIFHEFWWKRRHACLHTRKSYGTVGHTASCWGPLTLTSLTESPAWSYRDPDGSDGVLLLHSHGSSYGTLGCSNVEFSNWITGLIFQGSWGDRWR